MPASAPSAAWARAGEVKVCALAALARITTERTLRRTRIGHPLVHLAFAAGPGRAKHAAAFPGSRGARLARLLRDLYADRILLTPRSCAWLLVLAGCGSSGATPLGSAEGPAGDAGEWDDSSISTSVDGGGQVFKSCDAGAMTIVSGNGGAIMLPSNFVHTEFGGYALGPAIMGDGADAGVIQNSATANCSLVTVVVRDFKYA